MSEEGIGRGRVSGQEHQSGPAWPSVGGGWLSGSRIHYAVTQGEILIEPYHASQLNPNSYNYRLGRLLHRLTSAEIDMMREDEYEELTIPDSGTLLSPGECYLGSTLERFGSDCFASLVTGRSSVGRKFVTNHVTAGLIDVGFFGQITLEITVQKPTRIYAEIPFGQIFWFSVLGVPIPQYSGKYQRQQGPTISRIAVESGRTPDQVSIARPGKSMQEDNFVADLESGE
jgi:dCTP deaminase